MTWYGYEGKDTANIPVGKQDTSHVAAEVTAEQQGADIFNPPEPAEIKKLTDRLDILREECSQLWSDLHPMTKSGMPSKRPKYKEEEDLRERIAELDKEAAGISGYLSMVYQGFESEPGGGAYPSVLIG